MRGIEFMCSVERDYAWREIIRFIICCLAASNNGDDADAEAEAQQVASRLASIQARSYDYAVSWDLIKSAG